MTPGKPETERLVPFEFESDFSDIGTYKANFIFKRLTNSMEASIERTRAEMMGGLEAADKLGSMKIQAIATLTHAVIPVPDRPGWLDEVPFTFDRDLLYRLFSELIKYNNSFRKSKDGTKPENSSV